LRISYFVLRGIRPTHQEIRRNIIKREFNDVGLCIPHRHYMVNSSTKIGQIIELVEEGKYFTINRPRQFGKTTILALLTNRLNQRDDHVALEITFEELDIDAHQQQERFVYEFLMMLLIKLEFLNLTEPARFVEEQLEKLTTMSALSRFITRFVRDMFPQKSVV